MFHDISVEFEHGRPVCYDLVIDWLLAEYDLSVLPGNLKHVVCGTAAVKAVLEIPIESGRCQLIVEAIQKHFQGLSTEIENVIATFILMQRIRVSRFPRFSPSSDNCAHCLRV
jgi:hypothetical protein